MSRNRSIKSQLIHAISQCTTAGESKRSYMHGHAGDTGSNVYSLSHYENLTKWSIAFDSWIREAHPDVKRVRDITPVILQEYMQYKARTCNYNTLQRDLSYIHKMDAIVSRQYGGSWHSDRVSIPALSPDRAEGQIRGRVATQADYRILLAAMRSGGRSEAWKSLPLSRYTGFRVNETANVRFGRLVETGGRWGCGYVVLQGREDGTKGGRWRTIDILDPEAREALREVFDGKKHGDFVISQPDGTPLKTDSVMKALSRAKEKAGYDKTWTYEGHHAFRRLLAQESYDAIRCGGGSKREAEDYANRQLGHGKNRDDDTDRYVKSRW